MPKLIPDTGKESALFTHPRTGEFYVRKYVAGRGELCRRLETTDRTEAIRRKTMLLAEWLGTDAPKREITFEHVALEVLKLKEAKAVATYLEYELALRRHLLPYFQGRPIADVGGLWSQYKARQRKLTPARKVDHDRKALRAILGHAFDRGVILKIPRLPLDPMDKAVKEGGEYDNAEYAAILEAARPNLRIQCRLMMEVGMRHGDVRTLRKSQVDWATGIVTLSGKTTKMRKARVVALGPDLLAELAQYVRTCRTKPKNFCRKCGSPFVFPHRLNPFHEPIGRGDKSWQRLKARLGIDRTRHHMRHTAATRAIRAGVSEPMVQATLGMSDRVMKRVYLHANAADAAQISAAVGASFKKSDSD